MVKPGYKTTEFWLKLLALVATFLLSSGLFPAGHVALKIAGVVASVLGALGYNYFRATAKTKVDATVPDAVIAALRQQEEVLALQTQKIEQTTRELSLRHEVSAPGAVAPTAIRTSR